MKVKNLTFRHHPQAPHFFKNLSFELAAGQMHALHGKNGVGKSVLFTILSGKIPPEARMSGEVIAKHVELIHQQFDQTLVPDFSFLENLQMGSLPRLPSPFLRLKIPIIDKILKPFQIDTKIPVSKLSGGQRQVLALLLKLQRKPTVLLLDEPTATLDEENARMVFEFLKTLKGITFLVVCHDHALIQRYADGQHLYLETDQQGIRCLKPLL